VTPIVFDRYPRRALRIEDVVATMRRDVELPASGQGNTDKLARGRRR
jgi:hypothetical protein